jgi:hypothetical protein
MSRGHFVKLENGVFRYFPPPPIRIEVDCNYKILGTEKEFVELQLLPIQTPIVVRVSYEDFDAMEEAVENYFMGLNTITNKKLK